MLRIISFLALFVALSSFDIIDRDGTTDRIYLQHKINTKMVTIPSTIHPPTCRKCILTQVTWKSSL